MRSEIEWTKQMDDLLIEAVQSDARTKGVPGATQEEIDAAQNAVGVRFPPSYIAFLRTFNGGAFRYLRMHSIGEAERIRKLLEENPYSFPEDTYGDVVGYVTETDAFYARWKRPDDEEEAQKYTNPFWEGIAARLYFPFADDWGGSYFCFDLTQSDAEGEYPVLFWEHEDASKPPEFEAENFTALLRKVFNVATPTV